jgi:hypothetical protein
MKSLKGKTKLKLISQAVPISAKEVILNWKMWIQLHKSRDTQTLNTWAFIQTTWVKEHSKVGSNKVEHWKENLVPRLWKIRQAWMLGCSRTLRLHLEERTWKEWWKIKRTFRKTWEEWCIEVMQCSMPSRIHCNRLGRMYLEKLTSYFKDLMFKIIKISILMTKYWILQIWIELMTGAQVLTCITSNSIISNQHHP